MIKSPLPSYSKGVHLLYDGVTLGLKMNWTGSGKLFTDEMLELGNQGAQKIYWHHISFVNYLEKPGEQAVLPAFSHPGTWDWEQLQYMRHDLSFILAQEGSGWFRWGESRMYLSCAAANIKALWPSGKAGPG